MWPGSCVGYMCNLYTQAHDCVCLTDTYINKCMGTRSVHVLAFKWMYMSAHTQTRCSMSIFNLFIRDQSCGSCCHCHCPSCMLRCICSFYVCDHTLGVHCGKCFSQDADCGETLKQSFASFHDSKSFSHLHKPGDGNLTLSITNQLRGSFLKIHNICSLFFSLVWGGAGVVQAQTFFLDMHSMDNSGQRVSSPSPADRCDVGHRGH